MIDIQAHYVKVEMRDSIFKNVIKNLGPHDGTVIIKRKENSDYFNLTTDNNFIEQLIEFLNEFGEIVLVRFVEENIWVTFKNGISALAAVNEKFKEIHGRQIEVCLRSADWAACIEKEVGIFEDSRSSLKDEFYFDGVDKNKDLTIIEDQVIRNKSPPPPRPMPPTKYLESASAVVNDNFNLEFTSTKSTSDSHNIKAIQNNTPRKEVDLLLTTQKSANPPPLPTRQIPSTSSKTLPSILSTDAPPPVPSRLSGGPPIPKKN